MRVNRRLLELVKLSLIISRLFSWCQVATCSHLIVCPINSEHGVAHGGHLSVYNFSLDWRTSRHRALIISIRPWPHHVWQYFTSFTYWSASIMFDCWQIFANSPECLGEIEFPTPTNNVIGSSISADFLIVMKNSAHANFWIVSIYSERLDPRHVRKDNTAQNKYHRQHVWNA